MAKSVSGRQTSTKSGVMSTAKKLENSRYGFETHPSSRKIGGAFAQEKGEPRLREPPATNRT